MSCECCEDVSIFPSLEIYAYHYPENIFVIFDDLFLLLQGYGFFYSKKALLIDSVGCNEFNYTNSDKLSEIFLSSCKRKIRSVPSTISVPSLMNDSEFDTPSLIMSVSDNMYEGDPVVFSLKIILKSNENDCWPLLIDIMDKVISLFGYRLYYSMLGFGFVTNISKNSFIKMKHLSRRYLGANLYDPLCIHAKDIVYGLRTITWQMVLSNYALSQWRVEYLRNSGSEYKGNILFKTGDNPSVCDRNNLCHEFKEYMEMNNKLEDIINISDGDWLLGIDNDDYLQWGRRFSDINLHSYNL